MLKFAEAYIPLIMSSGFTQASNSSGVNRPRERAASLRVVFSE
jgi:hypothetical protein